MFMLCMQAGRKSLGPACERKDYVAVSELIALGAELHNGPAVAARERLAFHNFER